MRSESGHWSLPDAVSRWRSGSGAAYPERSPCTVPRSRISHWPCARYTGAAIGALPAAEWIRLWAGLSLPLLLIRHAVTTRLASALYGFEPNYERVVIMLLTSGTQGLQLALLAPGWIHGCLGLWFRLRHYPWALRMKPALLAFAALLPVLSAVGFIRMTRAVETKNFLLPAPDPKLLTHQLALDAWRHNLAAFYLTLIVTAFIAGQFRNRLERRRLQKDH